MWMNHGYSILELLIALALLGIALQISAHGLRLYIHTEASIVRQINQAQINYENWERLVSKKLLSN